MNHASLIAGIREHLRNSFQHTKIFVSDDPSDSRKSPLLKPYKERTPTFFIFFHSFRCADDLSESINVYTNDHKDGDIADLTALATPEIDTVYIGIITGQWTTAPLLDMFIRLLVEIADRAGRYFGSPKGFGDIFYPAYGFLL